MAKQNVELQLMALENLKRELENLVKDIETRANNYVVCVQSLMQADLDVNVAQKYKSQYWEQNNVLMAQLRERIKNYDIPYIDSCIIGAQTALANYKG
jgi:hypothetical protein